MPFAICRIQKIKDWGSLNSNESHTARIKDIPNANPNVDNLRLIGSPDDPSLATLVKNKIGEQKIRSNAVLAVELLLSASPEFFRPDNSSQSGYYLPKRLEDFQQATRCWLNQTFGDRIVRAELHLDESTPHIHAYLVPLDEYGKLNCRGLFGGYEKLYQLQDSYAAAMASIGLERGIKGSRARHTKINKYYAAVNQSFETLNLPSFFPQPQAGESSESYRQRTIELLRPQLEIINHQLADRTRLLTQKEQLKQTAINSEKLRQQLDRELQSLQYQTKQLQDLPPAQVAYELGLNHSLQPHIDTLDLVMQTNQYTFDQASAWLYERFGTQGMLQAVIHHARTQALNIAQSICFQPFVPPQQNAACWPEVEHYLTRSRCIPQKLVQALYKHRLVYADSFGNGVFTARNLALEVTGAYLHPTNINENVFNLYSTSRRSQGWFHISMGGTKDSPTKTAILVSSPIEALSLATLNVPHEHRTLYLTIDSEYAKIPVEFLQNVPTVAIAMSTTAARAIKKALPQAIHLKPNTTWNEQLKNQNSKHYKAIEEMER
ncbi:MobV family relaxase [Pelatocladus sp. BLCC-F211]|uniref:MobV family relaxase n=1 Tax=Pelatocladus sp. BLCC-F211 TaxID=3342752 RepID=UPI0035B83506